MGTHPIFESDFDCLTEVKLESKTCRATMETIKKKINALKEDNEIKQEEIERLQVNAKNAEEERERLEQELASMDNKIKLMEEQLEKTEEKLSSTSSALSTIETEKDEADRTLQKLSISDGDQSDKIVDLEAKLKEATMLAEEHDRKNEELSRKLVAVENDLERAEDKSD